jgi:hypothetical protein
LFAPFTRCFPEEKGPPGQQAHDGTSNKNTWEARLAECPMAIENTTPVLVHTYSARKRFVFFFFLLLLELHMTDCNHLLFELPQ